MNNEIEQIQAEKSKLRRALGFTDLVLFYVTAVVGLRWVATAAKVGPSAIVIWMLAFVFLFIPLALAVMELSSRYPEEGGLYVWTKRAFGDFHGFLSGWMYWWSNIVYFPGLLFFAASNAAYVIPRYAYLAENKTYIAILSMVGLVIALWLNLIGLNVGKWLSNASGTLGTWLPVLMLVGLGALAWLKFGSASDFNLRNSKPQVGSIYDIVFWSNIAFAFGGLESASFMGEEVRDARRAIPRALLVAGAMITFIYIAGTVSLLVALPQEQTSGLSGITDAIKVTGERVAGQNAGAVLGSLGALLQVIGYVGGVGAWMAATARLPFVAGLDRYLPAAFGKIHPKWGTPYIALLVQSAMAAIFIILAKVAGDTAEQAYLILVSLGIIAYFIPYLYLFASLVVLQREPAPDGVLRVPGGRYGAYLIGVAGTAVVALSLFLACIPGPQVTNKRTFFSVVFGTVSITMLLGILIYWYGRKNRK